MVTGGAAVVVGGVGSAVVVGTRGTEAVLERELASVAVTVAADREPLRVRVAAKEAVTDTVLDTPSTRAREVERVVVVVRVSRAALEMPCSPVTYIPVKSGVKHMPRTELTCAKVGSAWLAHASVAAVLMMV